MPAVNESTMIDSKGEVVTDFIDSVGTSSVSYTYTNTQTSLYVRNDSDVNITVTVGGSPTVIGRYDETTINAEYSSFSIVSASGIAAFYARSIRGVTTNNVSATSLNVVSGSATSPSISAIGDANTGMFFPASETVAFTTNGTEKVRINSDGQLVTRAGTVSLPAITPTGDSNTGIYFPAADTIAFVEGGVESMRVDSAGQIILPNNKNICLTNNAGTPEMTFQVSTANNLNIVTPSIGGSINYQVNNASGVHGFYTNGSPRMTITNDGKVGIGVTPNVILHAKDSGEILRLETTSATGNCYVRFRGTSTSKGFLGFTTGANNGFQINNVENDIMSFAVNNTEAMRIFPAGSSGYLLVNYGSSNGAYPLQVNGQIFATSSTIATSDARYKTDVTSLDGALDIVKALNPVQFSWKDHPIHKFNTEVPTVGFLAQEVEQVLADKPYLNSIVKKNETEFEVDGEIVKEEFLGIAEGNLIAILTKAVKELTEKVEALEAQLNQGGA